MEQLKTAQHKHMQAYIMVTTRWKQRAALSVLNLKISSILLPFTSSTELWVVFHQVPWTLSGTSQYNYFVFWCCNLQMHMIGLHNTYQSLRHAKILVRVMPWLLLPLYTVWNHCMFLKIFYVLHEVLNTKSDPIIYNTLLTLLKKQSCRPCWSSELKLQTSTLTNHRLISSGGEWWLPLIKTTNFDPSFRRKYK